MFMLLLMTLLVLLSTLMLLLKLILRHSVGSKSSILVASAVSPGHLSALGAMFAQETQKFLVDHNRRHHYLRVS